MFELRSERVEGGGSSRDAEYETDLDSWWPLYNGLETVSTDPSVAWLIYSSHEGTLTICGGELLRAAQGTLKFLSPLPAGE